MMVRGSCNLGGGNSDIDSADCFTESCIALLAFPLLKEN